MKDDGFSSIIIYLETWCVPYSSSLVIYRLSVFLLSSSFVCFFVLCYLHFSMEELSTQWKKLTLSESEENRVALRSISKKREFVLVGKFFTCRTLNVEAVVKNFRPLWHTKGGFNVTIGGENILLFAFELEVDDERVIQGKPWAFNRHLVVFERFDGYTSIQSLGFKKTTFWV